MNNEIIAKQFSSLTVWKKGGERAPHKPLLLLYALGKLLQNKDRMISYEEIDKKLDMLLREFGPARLHYRTEYPFWRLQNDKLWEVSGAEGIELNKSGDPKKRDLINYRVAGGFPKHLFNRLRADKKLAFQIVQELLDSNFPSSIHEDILQSVGIDIDPQRFEEKKRHPEFRENILRAYEYRCAVCGFDVRLGHFPIALEAAHIKWSQAGGPDTEVNGIALCALHHKLFDRGAFTLSDKMEILVSAHAYGTVGFQEWLMRFHGKKITPPQRKSHYPDRKFVNWHIREVFRGEHREL
ncbi:MAG: restriction endonuclease [Deferribacteres bacterium]|nr:restriction endonuclease [Deferribacteres bacterium]